MGGGNSTALTRASAYAPPSALFRALVSLLLLAGFYLLIVGAALVLFAIPVFALVVAFHVQILLLLVVCWVPAVLLLMSLFTTRRPAFAPPGLRLERSDASALFEMIDELAASAGTAPPTTVFLDVHPNLAVTEVGSVFRSRRVMVLGVPLLYLLTVSELRAGIAHELGHFSGGDTRLTTFSMQTHALFASVLNTVERDAFRVGTQHYAIEWGLSFAQALGEMIVNGYGYFYMRVTRPISRRQELAADALSASLVGGPIAASALEKVAIAAPLYDLYLEREVGHALMQGAMPTDVAAGFERLQRRILAEEAGQELVREIRTRATKPYDTHPALLDRLRALENWPKIAGEVDLRAASVLIDNPARFEAGFVGATRDALLEAIVARGGRVGELRELPWHAIPQEVFAPAVLAAARRAAARLHPLLPNVTTLAGMFAAVWRRLDAGTGLELIKHLEPRLGHLPRRQAEQATFAIGCELVEVLWQGALLERGATAEDSLGEPGLVFRLGEERIATIETIRELVTNNQAAAAILHQWANRFEQS